MIGKTAALIQIPDRRVFTVAAAAKYLGIDRKTLRKLTRDGKLPACKHEGHRCYLLEDLERYVDCFESWVDDSVPPKPKLAT
jgi:excisionase family DNA binding protein